MDQHCLLFYPLTIQFIAAVLQLLTLSDKIDQLVFLWIFALIIRFAHKLIMQFIESPHFVLFLFVDIMSLLDLYLIGDH